MTIRDVLVFLNFDASQDHLMQMHKHISDYRVLWKFACSHYNCRVQQVISLISLEGLLISETPGVICGWNKNLPALGTDDCLKLPLCIQPGFYLQRNFNELTISVINLNSSAQMHKFVSNKENKHKKIADKRFLLITIIWLQKCQLTTKHRHTEFSTHAV